MKQRVIVSALIEKHGDYLFLRQSKADGAYKDTLHIPGGGIQTGEDLEEAIRREILEETNIEVRDLRPAHFDSETLMFYKGEPHHLVFLQFTASYKSGKPLAGSDAKQLLWISPSDFSSFPLNPPTLRLLKALKLIT